MFILLLIFMGIGFTIEGINIWIEVIVGILLLLTGAALAWGIVDYMNDWLVVTDRRVVYQEKMLFVQQFRKEAPLEQIQNVDYRMTLLGRWLNFGTLVIQTAGTYGAIAFNYTTNFKMLRKSIAEQQVQRRQHAAAQSKTQIHRQLEKRIGLMLDPPSRVYTGSLGKDAITGWQDRVSQRMGLGLTKLDDDRIVWRKHWMALLPRIGWAWVIPFLILLISVVFWVNAIDGIPDNWRQAGVGVEVFTGFMILIFMARLRVGDRRLVQRHLRSDAEGCDQCAQVALRPARGSTFGKPGSYSERGNAHSHTDPLASRLRQRDHPDGR